MERLRQAKFAKRVHSEIRTLQSEPTDSEMARVAASMLAEIERAQHAALQRHFDALGIDPLDVDVDPEDTAAREDELLELTSAFLTGDVEAYWLRHHTAIPEDSVEDAAEFVGHGDWPALRETWAEQFAGLVEADDPDAVVEAYLQTKYGVDEAEWRDRVINFETEAALREVVAGPLEAVEEGVDAATAALPETAGGDQEGDQ